MSWFLGIAGKLDKNEIEKFTSLVPDYLYNIENDNLFILSGGIKETSNYFKTDENSGIILNGLPISNSEYKFSFFDIKKEKIVDPEIIQNMDGHFCGIKWDHYNVTFFNDKLGLRDLFFVEKNNKLYFSTRIDLLIKVTGENKINLNEFGAAWLLTHQISGNSYFSNIKRLGKFGTATYTNNRLTIKNRNWLPDFNSQNSIEDFENILENFLSFPLNNHGKLSLGLSGGLDSRVLLSYFLKENNSKATTHTFGEPEHPDIKLARKIAVENKIENVLLEHKLVDTGSLINKFQDLIKQTGLIYKVSDLFLYDFHKKLYDQNKIVIDGSWGEIFRRQFLNRMLLFGKKNLLNKDAPQIYNYLKYNRADIFNQDVIDKMETGAIEQIENIFNELPSFNEIGLENWADLFLLKTKLPNKVSASQALLDSLSISFVPFIQPSMLNSGLALNISLRKNNRLYKNIIKKNYPSLENFPLVKNDTLYPYFSGMLSSRIWAEYRKLRGQTYTEKFPNKLLKQLKDYAFDKVNSTEVKNYPLYDHKKITSLVDNYYKGNSILATEVEWWLTFEMYREKLLEKEV